MKSVFGILSAAALALRTGAVGAPADARSRSSRRLRPRARRQAGLAGGDRGGQGNPGDEERQRDVRRRRSQHRRADQERADAAATSTTRRTSTRSRSIVAKKLAGREKEIGDGMAQVYANEFTEQELKDLVTFYKSPLGTKLLASRAARDPVQHVLYEPVGAELRRGRRRPVPRRDEEARQGDLTAIRCRPLKLAPH